MPPGLVDRLVEAGEVVDLGDAHRGARARGLHEERPAVLAGEVHDPLARGRPGPGPTPGAGSPRTGRPAARRSEHPLHVLLVLADGRWRARRRRRRAHRRAPAGPARCRPRRRGRAARGRRHRRLPAPWAPNPARCRRLRGCLGRRRAPRAPRRDRPVRQRSGRVRSWIAIRSGSSAVSAQRPSVVMPIGSTSYFVAVDGAQHARRR